jgi:hypothetical protein
MYLIDGLRISINWITSGPFCMLCLPYNSEMTIFTEGLIGRTIIHILMEPCIIGAVFL